MKKMKSQFKVICVVLVIFIVLAGCSSSASDQNGQDDSKTITFWHPYGSENGDGIKLVVEEFEKQHPDINVDAVYIGDTDEKLLTAVAGGNPPDVVYFDRFKIASWASEGSLEDLTELTEGGKVSEDKYYPFAWEESSYDGKLYGIPATTDSRMVFYNKDQFVEVGLDPENPPKTIEELEDAAKKLTIKDGKRFERIGFIPWYGQGTFYGWGWTFGGSFFDKDGNLATATDPKNVEAMEWLTDYAKKYNVEDISGFTDSQGSSTLDPFLTGQISMKFDKSADVESIKKYKPDLNYGVFPLPTPTGEDHTTWSGGYSVVVPKGAEITDETKEFLEFWGGEEAQKIYNETYGSFAVIDSVNDEIGYKDDPVYKEFIDMLPESHSRPVMPEGSLYSNELATALENSIRGIGTPEENLEKVEKKVNKALNK